MRPSKESLFLPFWFFQSMTRSTFEAASRDPSSVVFPVVGDIEFSWPPQYVLAIRCASALLEPVWILMVLLSHIDPLNNNLMILFNTSYIYRGRRDHNVSNTMPGTQVGGTQCNPLPLKYVTQCVVCMRRVLVLGVAIRADMPIVDTTSF